MTLYDFAVIVLQIEIQMVDDVEAMLFGAFVVAAARRQNDDVQTFLHVKEDGLAAPAAVQKRCSKAFVAGMLVADNPAETTVSICLIFLVRSDFRKFSFIKKLSAAISSMVDDA